MRKFSVATIGQGPKHKWWALATVSVGIYMAVLDTNIVNISLPAIMDDFQTDINTVQWVVLSYLLSVTAFLLPAGRFADLWGRKRVYLLGFALFVVGTVLSGFATSSISLSLFRVIEALGAASLMANGMAITTSAFPSHERGKALGINSTVVALGAISGPTLGGLIVDSLGWRWIFFVNAPIGALGLALAAIVLREHLISTARTEVKKGFDWQGAVLSSATFVFALLALNRGDSWGWASPWTLGCLVLAGISAGAFLLAEQKPEAMVQLSLFRSRPFSAGLLAAFLTFSGISANGFLMPFYLQRVLDHSARTAGLLLLPLPIALAIVGPLSGRLSDRFGSRVIASVGLLVVITGLINIGLLGRDTGYGEVLVWLLLIGMGIGMFQAPNNNAILGSVSRSLYGVSAALTNLARNMGQTTGLALAGVIVTVTMTQAGVLAQLYSPRTGPALDDATVSAFADGMRNAYFAATALALFALVASLVRGPRMQEAAVGGMPGFSPSDGPVPTPASPGKSDPRAS